MTEEEGLEYAVQHVCMNCSELGKCDKGVHCEFLKIVRECYDDAIEIGRKENEQLNRDKTELTNSKTELENKVTELEKQIEKMKCCYNCKHDNDSNTDYYCEDCKRFAGETNFDKWECK